jgi:hypothetical protein
MRNDVDGVVPPGGASVQRERLANGITRIVEKRGECTVITAAETIGSIGLNRFAVVPRPTFKRSSVHPDFPTT